VRDLGSISPIQRNLIDIKHKKDLDYRTTLEGIMKAMKGSKKPSKKSGKKSK
jgi:hypothetical protein